jgi:CBS domain-containing protein
MATTIREVMTPDPAVLEADASIIDAAKLMRDGDHGDVLVARDGALCGIVTDRDIVVRGIAGAGADTALASLRLGDVCTTDLRVLTPDDSIDDAVAMMREQAVRRLPVVDSGRPVGIVSIGDLAIEEDERSALAAISAAPPNS